MTRLKTLHEKWAQDPEYRAAYDALEGEFALAAAIAAARSKAGLTQEQVAQRMHQSCFAVQPARAAIGQQQAGGGYRGPAGHFRQFVLGAADVAIQPACGGFDRVERAAAKRAILA